MQDAFEDLYGEALAQLGCTEDDPVIATVAASLRAPLHPNCYLSPTQMAAKFAVVGAAEESEEPTQVAASLTTAAASTARSTSKAAPPARRRRPRSLGRWLVLAFMGLALASVAALAAIGQIDIVEIVQQVRRLLQP